MAIPDHDALVAHHVLEFPGGYKRSLGPVIGRFLTELRDGKLVGVKLADGRVLVPPAEYDPQTSQATTGEYVPVGPGGVVTAWTWVPQPKRHHVLQWPFAWALVKLDGADTAMLHAVDAGDESKMATGMRVTARFRDERVGHITDLESFVPEPS